MEVNGQYICPLTSNFPLPFSLLDFSLFPFHSSLNYWILHSSLFVLHLNSLFLNRFQVHATFTIFLRLKRSSLHHTTWHWVKHSVVDKILQFAVWGEDNVAQTLKLHLVAVQ